MPSSSLQDSKKPDILKSDDWSQVKDSKKRKRIQNREAKRKPRIKARKQNEGSDWDLRNLNHAGNSYQGPGADGLDLTESDMNPSLVLPSLIQSSPGNSTAEPVESFTAQDCNYIQGQAAANVPYIANVTTTSQVEAQASVQCPWSIAQQKREMPASDLGSQGRRGIFPNAPGRPQAPVATSPAAKIIAQDAEEKLHWNNFHLPKHLGRHYLTHTDDRPYECTQCLKTFSRSYSLKRHFQKCSSRWGNLRASHWVELPVGYGNMDTMQNYYQEGPYSMASSGAHLWEQLEIGLFPMGMNIETGSRAGPLWHTNTWPIIGGINWNLESFQEPSDPLSALDPVLCTNTATAVFRKEGDEDDITSFLKFELSPSRNNCLEMKGLFPEYLWRHSFDVSQHVTGLTAWYYILNNTISVSFKLCAQNVSRAAIFDHDSVVKGLKIISAPAPVEHSRVATYLSSLASCGILNLNQFVSQLRVVVTPIPTEDQGVSLAKLSVSFELNPIVSENDLLHEDSAGIDLLNQQHDCVEQDCEHLLNQPSRHVTDEEADIPAYIRQGTPHQPASSDTSIQCTFETANSQLESFQWRLNTRKGNEFWMVV